MKTKIENSENTSLFHFTNLRTAIEYILPSMHLKLGLIENTNDPRENKSLGFGAFNGDFKKGEEISDHIAWNDKITKLLRRNTKVICFSSDYKIEDKWYDGYNLPRMWAQYGENHKGICLEIDIELFKAENLEIIEKSYINPIQYKPNFSYPWVNYDRIKEIGLDRYVDEFKIANRSYLFFSKFIDWQSEREVRLLHFSNTELDEYVSIKKSLKKIIVGIDFNNVYLPTIVSLVNGLRIEKIQSVNGHLESFGFKEEYLQNIMKINNFANPNLQS